MIDCSLSHRSVRLIDCASAKIAITSIWGLIAGHLFDVLKDYQIRGSQIAYFAADNATNNDTALAVLSERMDIDPVTSRLRCAGHIFNLVCTTILFGVPDGDALHDLLFM
jgi:hypothetical protein